MSTTAQAVLGEPSVAPSESPLPPLRLKAGERVVSPAHGVADVIGVEKREFSGESHEFYILLVPDTGIRLSVPVRTVRAAGIRPLMTRRDTDSVLRTLRSHRPAAAAMPWARRARVYRTLLVSGSPCEVARVMGDLARLRLRKELSFGERKMLDTARRLLVREVALVRGESEASVERKFGRAAGAPVD